MNKKNPRLEERRKKMSSKIDKLVREWFDKMDKKENKNANKNGQ
jgi:hypothetical protein